MKKPNGESLPTHFEQVPVEIVKKIIDQEAPKAQKSTPVVPQRISRNEG